MLVDSHCHIPLIKDATAEEVIEEAAAGGVGHLLCVCVDLEGFPLIRYLANRHARVFASVGVHPNTRIGEEPAPEQLAGLAADPRVIAIGETGLDYYRSQGDLDWQRQRFRNHIRAARLAGRPLIVHSREANTDVLRILAEEGAQEVGGVMHCFVEDWPAAQRAMDLGFYISLSGIVTFRSAAQVQEVARRMPLDRLLVETDAPYLAPVPFRGKPNRPAYVRHVAEFIASLRDESFDRIAYATTENFFRLFSKAVAAA